MKKKLLIILAWIGCATWLQAQEAADSIFDLSLDQLVEIEINVSSTKAQTVFNTPSTVSVLDADLLRRFNFLSVAEAIRYVAGMDVYQTNIDINVPTARGVLQNYYANKVLLMINGVPTWQAVYGNASIDRVDIRDVERIEVLRGPASVLYGTNAYTAVINLVLRNKADEGIDAKVQAGLPGMSSGGLGLNHHSGPWKWYVSANSYTERFAPYLLQNQQTEPYANNADFTYREEHRRGSANLVLDYKGWSLFGNTFYNSYVYPGINISFGSGAGLSVTDRGVLAGVRYEGQVKDALHISSFVSLDYFDRDWPVNVDRTRGNLLETTRTQANFKVNYALSSNLDLELGTEGEWGNGDHRQFDLLRDTLVRVNMKASEGIRNVSVFGQLAYRFGRFSFLGGSRLVSNNLFGENVSSRLSSVVALAPKHSLKLIWGQAYRAPSMLEMYFDHPTVVGNPDLLPEQHQSYELAYVGQFSSLFVQSIVYYSAYSSLINRYTPTGTTTSRYRNEGAFEAMGAEFEVKYQSDWLTAFANYNYLQGAQDDDQHYFDWVPQHTLRYGLHKPIAGFTLAGNGMVVSAVRGPLGDIRPQHTFDLHASYRHSARSVRVEHTLSWKNVPNGPMLYPQYIRSSQNINEMPTMGWGQRLVYTLRINL